ncbi:uncharacterized protein LOC112573209 [Pomacea canaliculata]|uniref:uncharacterized protein LOC112573209 n=1 Tax=Pomacea canaliculata TaxID=400727 RepID=UPI000D72C8B6|nr:uncharacterized protein LOC112573209 [Pomacea canaliculata]
MLPVLLHKSLSKQDKLQKAVQHILSLLEEMKTDVKDVKNRLAQMECQTQEKELTSDTRVTVSLKIFRGVECLKLDLKTDPGKRARLECYLAMRGGFSLKLVVRGILSVLFSTELARCYNYNGLKGKKGLKNHPFILRTVQGMLFGNAWGIHFKAYRQGQTVSAIFK